MSYSVSLRAALVVGLVTAQLVTVGDARAQEDEKELGWFNTSELSFVLTAGNAQSNTFGLANILERVWPTSALRFGFGGIRSESSITTRTAVGPAATDFQVTEDKNTQKTAENYYARGRYDYDVSSKMFVYGGAGWDRNEFAGIENRYAFAAGLGNAWFDSDVSRFRTDYAITYTIQDDVVEIPGADDKFVGARISYTYLRALTGTTQFQSDLILDENLEETEDFRGNLVNSIAVAISQALALKTSLSLLYDNQPSLVAVPRELADGTSTGENVNIALDELDSIFTVAVVVKI
jgi:putative salt-induced outer membrane protein YdiY